MKTKIILILLFGTLCLNNSYGQEFKDFTGFDLMRIVKSVDFKFVNRLKGLSIEKLPMVFNDLPSRVIKQINISAWVLCYNSERDNFEIYNYYYTDISRVTYDKYCKQLNALMIMDNVVKQPN